METISLVEVSPSMEIILKLSAASAASAFCSSSDEMAQSVVRKTSIVAMFGWIIPEPLAMPPSLHSTPPTVKATATSLRAVSVVIIASAASRLPVSERASFSAPIEASMGEMSSR